MEIIIVILVIALLLSPYFFCFYNLYRYRTARAVLIELWNNGRISDKEYERALRNPPSNAPKVAFTTETQPLTSSKLVAAPIESTECGAQNTDNHVESTKSNVKETNNAVESTNADVKETKNAVESTNADVKETKNAVESTNADAQSTQNHVEKSAQPVALKPNTNTKTEPVRENQDDKHIATILGIGVALICTAGVAFVTSSWNTLTNFGKLGVIAASAAVFFGAFWLAHSKFNLKKSAQAFYILGMAMLATTAFTAEILNVVYLGDSTAALTFLPAVIVMAGMIVGHMLWQSRVFEYLSWGAAALAVCCLTRVIAPHFDYCAIVDAIILLSAMTVCDITRHKRGLKTDAFPFVVIVLSLSLSMFNDWHFDDQNHANTIVGLALIASYYLIRVFSENTVLWRNVYGILGTVFGSIALLILGDTSHHSSWLSNSSDETLIFHVVTYVLAGVLSLYTLFRPGQNKDSLLTRHIAAFSLLIILTLSQYIVNERDFLSQTIVLVITAATSFVAAKCFEPAKRVPSISLGIVAALWAIFPIYFGIWELATNDLDEALIIWPLAIIYSIPTACYGTCLRMTNPEAKLCTPVLRVFMAITAFAAIFFTLEDFPDLFTLDHVRQSHDNGFLWFCGLLAIVGAAGTWLIQKRALKRWPIMSALATYLSLSWIFVCYIDQFDNEDVLFLGHLATAAVLAALAFVTSRGCKGVTATRMVWLLPAISLICVDEDPYHFIRMLGILLISANLLQYLTDRGRSLVDKNLISTAVMLPFCSTSIYILVRDTFIPDEIIPEVATCLPIIAAYGLKKWLRPEDDVFHNLVLSLSTLLVTLLYLVPTGNELLHACTASAIAIGALIYGLHIQRLRYLTAAAIVLLIVFFGSTDEFWRNLHWWVYLLVIGVIFVTIAVYNEASKRRGEGLVKKLKSNKIVQWKW